ncbi:PepSY domain-containing protein [Thermomonas haemolytica]|uniref:YpeB-like protein with protease inhibitory function n=1 Tax=Thermomonas haemolytica TaxID=141949 RepID=A0A4R3MYA3_9GAMM|nr:hypothetical protein [Thermomonas haemolytica]TCT21640.1 hypothetical protein EDC34_10960 [Thermomonas haemolytica]
MSRLPHASLNLLAAAVLAALPAASAWAQQPPPWMQQGAPRERPQPPVDLPQQRRDNLSDAVRRAERDTRGEVLSAERIQFDGRDMHRVKVVDDQGRVRVYMQDPARRGDGGRRPPARDGDD